MLGPKFGTIKSYYKNQIIFKQEQEGDVGYLIRTGTVCIFKMINDEKKILANLGPGEVFGEMGLINNSPRTAYAQALQYCDLVVIDKETLFKLLKQSPKMIQSITLLLMKRLANTLHLLEDDSGGHILPKHFLCVCSLLDLYSRLEASIDFNDFCKTAAEVTFLSLDQIEIILNRLNQLNIIQFDEPLTGRNNMDARFRLVVDSSHLIKTAKEMGKSEFSM